MRRASGEVFQPSTLLAKPPWLEPWSAAGVVGVLLPMVTEQRRARLEDVLGRRLGCVTVLLDSPHDPHNGAAVMRSCDAFGVQELHVIARAEPFFASNVVSKGAERWVDVVEHDGVESAHATLACNGFELIAAHPGGDLTPEDLATVERPCLVLGNERAGISPELQRHTARCVRIPMVGFVESLNLSVSAAILLRAATHGRPGDLAPATRQRLLGRALFHSVPRAAEILAALPPC